MIGSVNGSIYGSIMSLQLIARMNVSRLQVCRSARLHEGLHKGLREGLREGLHKGLREGLHEGLLRLCTMLCPKLTPCCEAAPVAQHDGGIGYSIE